jgi:predicted DNA-binding transcriptional regulator YafY
MAKVSAVLPPPLRTLLVETALFAPGFLDASARSAELTPLRRAIADARKVRFTYTDQEGRETERTVRPLALYYWGRTWTLGAFCELRAAYRNFRPDRMTSLRLLADRFEPDATASLAGYVAEMEAEATRRGFTELRGVPLSR